MMDMRVSRLGGLGSSFNEKIGDYGLFFPLSPDFSNATDSVYLKSADVPNMGNLERLHTRPSQSLSPVRVGGQTFSVCFQGQTVGQLSVCRKEPPFALRVSFVVVTIVSLKLLGIGGSSLSNPHGLINHVIYRRLDCHKGQLFTSIYYQGFLTSSASSLLV